MKDANSLVHNNTLYILLEDAPKFPFPRNAANTDKLFMESEFQKHKYFRKGEETLLITSKNHESTNSLPHSLALDPQGDKLREKNNEPSDTEPLLVPKRHLLVSPGHGAVVRQNVLSPCSALKERVWGKANRRNCPSKSRINEQLSSVWKHVLSEALTSSSGTVWLWSCWFFFSKHDVCVCASVRVAKLFSSRG